MEAPYEIWLIGQAVSKEKKFENVESEWPWTKSQWMTLTFDIHIDSFTHLANCIYQFWSHRLQQFLKNLLFYHFPIQKVFTIYGHGCQLKSCDLDCLNKLLFPHRMKVPYEIWLWLAKRFLGRRCLNSVDNVRRTTEAYLSYKLTNEPKGSG